jgi:hypothetical protein
MENKIIKTEPVKEKKCRICKEFYQIEFFYFRKDSKRYRTECKKCFSEKSEKYRNENKEKIRAVNKEYIKKNKDKIAKYKYEQWRNDPTIKERNRKSVDKRRIGMDAEKIKNEKCEMCGITNSEHIEKYGKRLHVHHVNNNGRRNIRLGLVPVHDELQILCMSCHPKVDNKNDKQRYIKMSETWKKKKQYATG